MTSNPIVVNELCSDLDDVVVLDGRHSDLGADRTCSLFISLIAIGVKRRSRFG